MTTPSPAWQKIAPTQALTRWRMTPPDQRLLFGVARPLADLDNYVFRNGWTKTGDLPCRTAWRAQIADGPPDRPTGPFDLIYPGLDGAEVDFSTFCFRPTLIRRGLQCLIHSDEGGVATFRVATCGRVHIWIDADLVGHAEPADRNRMHSTDITLDLPKGTADLTVQLEDLHERDTTCAMSLRYLGGPELWTALSDAGSDLDATCAQLAALRLDSVYHDDAMAHLVSDPPPERPLTVQVSSMIPFGRGGLSVDPDSARHRAVTLTPDQPSAPLFHSRDALPGCLSLALATPYRSTNVTRSLGTTNLPRPVPLTGDLAQRKAQASAAIAAHGGFEPSRAALLAQAGMAPDIVAHILDAALSTIEHRYDCSDFSILPVLRLWANARDTLTPALQDRLRSALLSYRYWLTTPGDDVMWFWSENHVLCFHSAQRIAGLLFPDTRFDACGRLGRDLAAEALDRLTLWFDAIDRDGLCEWNSAAYYPIDLLGLFTLHDMDPALRARAARVMDRISIMTALHTSGGTPAGSQGRCYEKELLAGPCTELGAFAAIAFGAPFRPGYDRAAALFCLSDYVPPANAAAFAAPHGKTVLQARYTQGIDHAGKLTLWKSAQGQLSTVAGMTPGVRGHHAQMLDVQLAGHPMARLWINHPGELKPWGDRRPSLLAGSHVVPQVAQFGSTALMIHDTQRPWSDLPFAQVFAARDALSRTELGQGWHLFSDGTAHVGLWCSGPLQPTTGIYAGSLWRTETARSGWVVAMREPDETADTFTARLLAHHPVFDASGMTLRAHSAAGDVLDLAFEGDLHVNGVGRPFEPLTPEPQVSVDGAPLSHWSTS